MSALNTTETENLRKVKSTIEAVLREGYSAGDNDFLHNRLIEAKKSLKDVIEKKGYYPNG